MSEFYLYSIGHGNKSMDEFMSELQQFSIKYLIDVRSKPYSKYYPHFNKEQLITYFSAQDIVYDWWGEMIGGLPPASWNCITSEGKVDYEKMSHNQTFIKGIERLVKANEKHCKTAIMCSESDPHICHRSKLIGKMLAERGVELQHIVLNKMGNAIIRPQSDIFTDIINDVRDLFSNDIVNIKLTSVNAHV
ncbi:MAG: DUF488 domain-containing protein [Prevotellaceae bacterium]|nr:DUF488 domain-containing protein [Candidatus Faecinaster equi]